MISTAMRALLTRRRTLMEGKDEKGFTLIELLVVVIIIGILAAIAIPIYLGVQNSSKDSSAETDATNLKIALVAYATNNPTATTAPTISTAAGISALSSLGATQGPNTSGFAYSGTNTWPAFCIKATSSTSTIWYVTDALGATKTKPSTC